MDKILESIHLAVAADATPEARAAGIVACRTIVTALEAVPGQPLTAPAQPVPSPPPIDNSRIGAILGALRGMPPDKLLDVAIAQLRAKLPAGAEAPTARPIAFHLVPISGARKP